MVKTTTTMKSVKKNGEMVMKSRPIKIRHGEMVMKRRPITMTNGEMPMKSPPIMMKPGEMPTLKVRCGRTCLRVLNFTARRFATKIIMRPVVSLLRLLRFKAVVPIRQRRYLLQPR